MLRAIQDSTDGWTTSVLSSLGLDASWHCLELGAGEGSIARWLARRCASVTAVDVEPVPPHPGVAVVEADVTDPAFSPGRFDLVHARFLVAHLPEREAFVARAAREWLRPGGVLVITDPVQLADETSPYPVVRRIMAAYRRMRADCGTDLDWARRLPAAMGAAGLSDVDYTGRLGRMGGAGDRWRPLIEHWADELVAGGLERADLDEFRALCGDPAFVDIPQVIVTSWGFRLQ